MTKLRLALIELKLDQHYTSSSVQEIEFFSITLQWLSSQHLASKISFNELGFI